MEKVKIILDPGSTHMARLDYAVELTKVAADSGADAIKWQLFKNLPPNIELPREWFPELVEYGKELGIEVFASCFDYHAIYLLIERCCKSIKFSYSKSLEFYSVYGFETVYKSFDIMNFPYGETLQFEKYLYCIPEYPVKYEVNFDGIFPLFDGFSDHTLGYRQTIKAVEAGARIIEKHFTLDHKDINCPDSRFALKPHELKCMVSHIRELEKAL